MTERLLKPGEVDIFLRYPDGRTMRLIRKGLIPAIKLPDGEIRIKESTLAEMVRQGADCGNR